MIFRSRDPKLVLHEKKCNLTEDHMLMGLKDDAFFFMERICFYIIILI